MLLTTDSWCYLCHGTACGHAEAHTKHATWAVGTMLCHKSLIIDFSLLSVHWAP
jgi:hypothetical protein